MSSVIRVNQLNNRVGLGTITITDQGQTLSGISTGEVVLWLSEILGQIFAEENNLDKSLSFILLSFFQVFPHP
jgi:hypothetical protein